MSNKPIELHQEDLELDEDDEIVVPYEILNPNESILPLLQHTSPSNRSRSNTLNGPPTPVSAEKSHQPHANSALEEDFDVLPIESFREEILSILDKNQIMILIGETGSGKTTQIPQFLLNSSYLKKQKMAVTQPRRIAAISVAKRVSEEVGCSLGEEIGYTVRFDDLTNLEKTKVKFMTDGILIRECLSDPLLKQYSIIMLDEAHERSLNTDILFGLLKKIISQRNDLKLIITSATLDAEKFSAYFHSCPILSIPGRNYPVDIYHSKTKQIMTINGPANTSYIQSAVDVIVKIHLREEEGHILVFLTGQEEIEKACLLLKQTLLQYQQDHEKNSYLLDRELIILPLYAALSNEEQIKIFQKPHLLLPNHNTTTPIANATTIASGNNKLSVKTEPASSTSKSTQENKGGKILRKCVIATNIAETSITVPHVRFVVDAGYVKQKVYDPSRGMESLVVVPTSKIAALQRAGRAGRTGPGQCYRLYSSECFDNMMDETIPEIQRTNLANTILYLKAIGINNVLDFDFLDPPSQDQVLQALNQLFMLKAIADNGEITVIGRKMSNFPLDPCLSRMLLESATRELHCLEDMVIVCSMLCVENVFYKPKLRKSQITNPSNKGGGGGNIQTKNNLSKYGPSSSSSLNRGEGDQKDRFVRQLTAEEERIEIAHAGLRSEYGDFITLWNIFQQFEKFHYTYEWCERNFINFRSMKTARKIREHLQQETKKFHLYEFADQYLTPMNNSRSNGKEGKEGSKGDKKKEQDHISDLGLEKRLCYAITSGYFMNAAMQCTNDSVYKCLTLPSSTSLSKSANPDLRLVYISPQSAFAYTTPSEYVIYQELVFNNKLYMRNISYVNKKRLFSFINDWKPVPPLQLSGIQVTKTESAKVSSIGTKRDREEVTTKVVMEEDQAVKRGKTESTENVLAENNAKQLSAVEQAKLRYMMRKNANS